MSVIFPQVPARLRRALGRFVSPAGAALFSLVLASCAGGGFGGAGDTSDISGVNPVSQPAPVASGPISPASQRKVAEAVSGLNLGEETPPISPEDIAVSNDSGILDSNPFSSSAPAARLSGWGARADSTRKTQGYKAFEVAVPSGNPLMTIAVWISETPPDYPEGKPEQDPEADRKFLYLRLRVFIEAGNAALVEGGGVEVLDSEVIVVEEKRPDPKPIVPEEPESQPDPNAPVLVAVNFSLSGSGTVLAEGESGALVAGGEVRQGSTVIFTATPNRGYQVSAWLGDCAGTAAAATSCAVAATRDVSAGAIFTDINECATNTHVCAAEGGLCANTDGGFTCSCAVGYSGDGVTCNGDKAVSDPNAPVLAAVNFSSSGSGTVSAEGESGALVAGGEIRQGSTVIFTATPGAGYYVSGWSGNCADAGEVADGLDGTAKSCAAAADSDLSVRAEFSEIPSLAGPLCPSGSLPANGLTRAELNMTLRLAARGGDATRVCEALRRGAEVNDNLGDSEFTALQEAVDGGYLNVSELLLANGAEVNKRKGGAGRSPLDLAARDEEAEIAALLRNAGGRCFLETGPLCGDIPAATPDPATVAATVAGYSCPAGSLPRGDHTQEELDDNLHAAGWDLSAERVCEWLRRGADVNAKRDHKTLLHGAAWGAYEIAALLLAHGADVNAKDLWKDTPLYAAAIRDNREMAALLLAHGADVNAKNYGNTPLHEAAHHNSEEVAALLIENGADVNAEVGMSGRGTPLHAAARRNSEEVAALLLANGADVNARAQWDGTPLHQAAYHNSRGIVALLLANGADVNAETISVGRNNLGGTALDIARRRSSSAVVALLEAAKIPSIVITVAATVAGYSCPAGSLPRGDHTQEQLDDNLHAAGWDLSAERVCEWLRRGANVNAKRDHKTLLHGAAWGAYEIAALLLAHGADVNAKNLWNNTPLYAAATRDNREMAALLIANGADVNAKNYGNTPLHEAAGRNSEEVAALLIENGADVNAEVDFSGKGTPLHEAARENSEEVAALLLANGADVNARAQRSGTPLHQAAYHNSRGIVALLLTNGADVNAEIISAESGLGGTALDMARRRRNSAVVALLEAAKIPSIVSTVAATVAGYSCPAGSLPRGDHTQEQLDDNLHAAGWDLSAERVCEWLRRGANVNAKRDHKTLLHVAAWGAYEMAALLLAHGADVNAKNLWKDPPLYAAATRDNREMAALLIANGADVNAKNYGNTPLHEAAFHNSEEVAALLIENGADVNAEVDMSGRGAPLHVAARQNSEEVAALLLANGADVNARAQWDGTPLHEAARHNSAGVAALLLANGADVNAEIIDVGGRSNLGGTALDIARKRRNSAVVSLLEAAENLPVAAEADALAKELRESFAGAFNPSPAFGDAFGAVSGASEKILTRLDSLMRSTAGSGGDAWDSFSGWQRENDVGRMWFSTNQRGDFGFGAGGNGAGGDLSVSPFAALAGNGMLAGGETGFGESGKLRIAAFGDYQARSLLDGSDREWTQWAARGTAIEKAMTEAERFSGLSENRTRGAMTEIHLGGGDLGVALQAGAVSESDSVLSGTAGNDDLRGLRSRTAFAGLSGAADLFGSGWRLRGSAHLGRSWTESEGLLRDGDLWASAFSAGLERGGWLYLDDGFVLRFSQPLRVESWEMRLAGEQGGRWLGAGPSGRQLDVDAAYRLPLSGGGWLLLSAGVRRDGGHSSSSDLEAGALFSVERGF